MSKHKTESSIAAGKLISSIQKEWGDELGELKAEKSEMVMNRAHTMLQAGSADKILQILGENSVSEYLGTHWLNEHANVGVAVQALEEAINRERT